MVLRMLRLLWIREAINYAYQHTEGSMIPATILCPYLIITLIIIIFIVIIIIIVRGEGHQHIGGSEGQNSTGTRRLLRC